MVPSLSALMSCVVAVIGFFLDYSDWLFAAAPLALALEGVAVAGLAAPARAEGAGVGAEAHRGDELVEGHARPAAHLVDDLPLLGGHRLGIEDDAPAGVGVGGRHAARAARLAGGQIDAGARALHGGANDRRTHGQVTAQPRHGLHPLLPEAGDLRFADLPLGAGLVEHRVDAVPHVARVQFTHLLRQA